MHLLTGDRSSLLPVDGEQIAPSFTSLLFPFLFIFHLFFSFLFSNSSHDQRPTRSVFFRLTSALTSTTSLPSFPPSPRPRPRTPTPPTQTTHNRENGDLQPTSYSVALARPHLTFPTPLVLIDSATPEVLLMVAIVPPTLLVSDSIRLLLI